MKKMSVFAALLMVLAFTTLALGGQKHGLFERSGQLHPAMAEALKLTPEQTEKIEALQATTKEEMTQLKAQLTTKRAEMKLLWTQMTLDVEKIKATQKEIQAIKTKMRDIRTDKRIAFRQLLTPEQTSALLALSCGRDGRSKKGKKGGYGKGRKAGSSPCVDCPRNQQ